MAVDGVEFLLNKPAPLNSTPLHHQLSVSNPQLPDNLVLLPVRDGMSKVAGFLVGRVSDIGTDSQVGTI